MKKIIPILFVLLLAATPAWGAYDCSGVNGLTDDNSTDNKTALEDCLTNADAEGDDTMTLPVHSDYCYFSGEVTVPDNVIIQGQAGSKLRGQLLLGNDSATDLIEFGNADKIIQINTQADAQNGTVITGARVSNCNFPNAAGTNAIIGRLTKEIIIDNNTITSGSQSSTQMVLFTGGAHDNIVVNNTIYGGKTCVLFKSYYSTSNGGYDANFINNIVMANECDDQKEERISFDGVYDSVDAMATREYDTVSSVSSDEITLTSANWGPTGGADESYIGQFMVVVEENSGSDAVGIPFKITGQSNAVFTLETASHNIAANDEVTIGSVFYQNYVAFNYIHGLGYQDAGVLLYGMAFYNRIEENDMGGTDARSCDNERASATSVTGACGRAPNGYNLWRANTIDQQDVGSCYTTGCRIELFWRNHASDGCSFSEYTTYGNVVVDNILEDRLQYRWQNYRGDDGDNTVGDTQSILNSTDAGAPAGSSLDITDWTCEEYGLTCVAPGSTIALVADLNGSCPGDLICAGYGPPGITSIEGVSINTN